MRLWGATARSLQLAARLSAAPAPAGRRARAPGGRSSTAVTDGDEVLDTAVPVVRAAAAPPRRGAGAAPAYGPVADDIRDRTRRLDLALAIVALLAYLLALPGLIRAGRALRAQYDPRRVELMRDLRRAIERDELVIHYHPISEARRRVRSAEALVRWKHPRRGPIAPDRFIPMIEPTELMWPLTVHIFELRAPMPGLADQGTRSASRSTSPARSCAIRGCRRRWRGS